MEKSVLLSLIIGVILMVAAILAAFKSGIFEDLSNKIAAHIILSYKV